MSLTVVHTYYDASRMKMSGSGARIILALSNAAAGHWNLQIDREGSD